MEGYELGKDIQEIKMRINQIEEFIERSDSGVGMCRNCHPASFQSQGSDPVAALAPGPGEPKVFLAGRIDAQECECREQTLTVYPDGRYTHVAVHHNHSNLADDGDTHRLTIHVRAGSEIVESFGSERFVPRRRDRTHPVDGVSENMKRRFDVITGFDGSLECA